jgi:hypothetical protein
VTYVFVFVGEFGYELLNWQGVIRKFRRLNPNVRVICASRGNVQPLYENAEYVDISEVPEFAESMASGYFANVPDDDTASSEVNRGFDARLRRALKRGISRELRKRSRSVWLRRQLDGLHFIFSSGQREIDNCKFGADRRLFGDFNAEGNIYSQLDLSNNLFRRLEPDLHPAPRLEEAIGRPLEQPYLLVQTRKGGRTQRSEAEVDESRIISALARELPVVLTEFGTGRPGDSYSELAEVDRVSKVEISGLGEQSCLVHHASACIFLTEGDFGSHIYVPPFLGRDVWAVAARDVYRIGTTPIEFWNQSVFRFGGQIRPLVAEELDSQEVLDMFARDVVAGASEASS